VSGPVQFVDLAAQQRRIRGDLDAAIARVLDHGRYIMGPEVGELEDALADFCGAPHVVSCASGTDALVMALMARGVGPGDAVAVPSFTFAATAEAVALLGATPLFVDVGEDTFNLDPGRLDAALADPPAGLRVVGTIPVDLFGRPAEHPAIAEVAGRHGAWVVADAAQSFGASLGGVAVGALAPVTTTSFFPAKPLGCYGDGGAVFCDDADDAALLRSIRVHGSGTHKYDNARIGVNGRLDTLQAAILLQKLAVFPDELVARRRVAATYRAALAGAVQVPGVDDDAPSAWAQFTIRVPDRDAVAARLRDAGVPTAVYYPRPLHRQTAYRDFPLGPGGLPVSERLADDVLSLPMHPYLSDADLEHVIGAVLTR
jgi:dTDP-4-amino-4,6-dideoxygalactose transaminase